MTISALKLIIKALITEAKLNTKPVYVYHISDNANLRFPLTSGVYSPKFEQNGLFVAPLSAIKNSWAHWAAGKSRFASSHGDKEAGKRENQRYKNLTLYKLELPKWVLDKAEAEHEAKAEESSKANPNSALGAWGWDLETFIPEELFKHVKLARKQTGDLGEFLTKRGEAYKHRKGQKIEREVQYSVGPENKLVKNVIEYGKEPTSLETILKSRDESIKLLNKQELENVVSKLEYFFSPEWIEDTVKRYKRRAKVWQTSNREKEYDPYYKEMRLKREQEAEKERSENKENAERKLSIARNLLKR
jgi:hypothetical protein